MLALWLALWIPAHAQTERRVRDALWDCERVLAPSDSLIRRTLSRRFQKFTLTDEPEFAGTLFAHEDERADLRTFRTPDLHLPKQFWRIALWREYSSEAHQYWFYDVGFKNLENDARAVNLFVARKLNQHRQESLRFTASPLRMTTLAVMERLRWEFHRRVIDEYKRRPSRRAFIGPHDVDRMIMANQNSNVDVFGVTDRAVAVSSSAEHIAAALLMTLQISYDEPADFLRPSLDGLLRTYGEPSSQPRRLPFMFRLTADHRDEFIESFWHSYGHLRVCEIARYKKDPRTPAAVEARMLLEALQRLTRRGCQLVVANQSASVFQLFEPFGFIRDRRLPTGHKRPEHLVVLHVNSPQFWATYGRLRSAAGFD